MKRIFSDTIFSRLFGLAMAAVMVSHIMTFVLLFVFLGEHLPPHPPGRMDEIGHHSVPASASYLSDSPRLPPPHHEEGLMPDPFLGFFVSMMLQLIILAMAAWWGSRSLAKPLQGMAQAARQIGDKLNPPALLESGPAEVLQAAYKNSALILQKLPTAFFQNSTPKVRVIWKPPIWNRPLARSVPQALRPPRLRRVWMICLKNSTATAMARSLKANLVPA